MSLRALSFPSSTSSVVHGACISCPLTCAGDSQLKTLAMQAWAPWSTAFGRCKSHDPCLLCSWVNGERSCRCGLVMATVMCALLLMRL